MSDHDDTIPIADDTTEPVAIPDPRKVTVPVERFEAATEVEIPQPALTPEGLSPVTPRPSSVGEPVLALAKPTPKKSSASFVDKKNRLPTESEIKDAIDGTPTDEVPVVD